MINFKPFMHLFVVANGIIAATLTSLPLYGLESGSWTLGTFQINFTKGQSTGKIVVQDRDNGQILWESLQDQPILEGIRAREKVSFSRGSFGFAAKTQGSCRQQQFTKVVASPPKVLRIEGKFLDCPGLFSLSFHPLAQGRLQLQARLNSSATGFNHSVLHYASRQDQGYYGFGTQYSKLNMKGQLLPIWSQEQGIGRGRQPMSFFMNRFGRGSAGYWHTTYTGVPSYIKSTGGGLLLENTEYLEFDFRQNDRSSVRVWSPHITLQILKGTNPKEVLRNQLEVAGAMNPLPLWTQSGLIVRGKGGSKEVRQTLAQLKRAGTPVAAVWIEDWPGERQTLFGARVRWDWQIDRHHYPDFEQLVKDIRKDGIRVLTYFNPMLLADRNIPNSLYKFAESRGYLVRNRKGHTYQVALGGFKAGLVDLTNPAARAWIKSLIQSHVNLGVSGWLADFGETLPPDAVLFNGQPADKYHNRFVDDWVSLNREVIDENQLQGEGFFMSRSGTLKTPGKAMSFWIGDQNVTWDQYDGMQTVIPALLSSGLSSYTQETIDVGGWISLSKIPVAGFTRNQELLLRWLDIGVFTNMLRFHHTNEPEKNHQYNSDSYTLGMFTKAAKFFQALGPYKMKLMEEAKTLGLPLIRHMMIEFPEDPKTRGLSQQFMLGQEFLVAPVVTEGATHIDLYLPEGQWVNLWSGEELDLEKGRWIKRKAPIGKPPVFHRKGSQEAADLRQRMKSLGLLD